MNIYNKIILSTVALAATLTSSIGFSDAITKSPDVAESGVLMIANTLDYAPFEYLDEDGNQTGIIIEMANSVAEAIGVELKIQRTPFPSIIPGLAAGRFKIAWETFSAKPDRLKQVDFIMFLKAGVVASTMPSKVDSFTGENPLCGKSIGVAPGSVADFLVEKLNEECKAKDLAMIDKSIFNNSTDIIQSVLSGRIDARLDDATASSYFETTSKGKLVVLPKIYEVSPLGMAVAKDDKETVDMMLSALSTLFENGKYQEILDKYGMGIYSIEEPYFVGSMDDLRQN